MSDRSKPTIDTGPGKTKQSMRDECDVNFIMNKWKRTGELPPTHSRPPTYGDFSNVGDYMQAKNAIIQADQSFAELPSWLRDRFYNDPAEFLAYMDDSSNLDEQIKLGLVKAPEGYEAPEPAPEPTPEAPSEPAPAPTPPPTGD